MSDSEGDLFGDESGSPRAAPSSPPRSPSKAKSQEASSPAPAKSRTHSRSRSRSRVRSRSRSRDSTPPSDEGTPRRDPLEYDEDDDVEETHEQWGNLPLPTWPHLSPTDGKVWHLKIPASVGIEAEPFDAIAYRDSLGPDDVDLVGADATRRMRAVRNTMRWRWSRSAGGDVRQSNARMVRWSDGSVSLQLGDNMFDLQSSYGTTLARPDDPQPADQTGSNATTFLVVTAPGEQVLVTEAAIEGQLSLVPTSIESATHRERIKQIAKEHVRHAKLKNLDELGDSAKVAELLARTAPQRVARPRSNRPRNSTQASERRKAYNRRTAVGKEDDSDEEVYGRRRDREREYDEDDGFVVADESDDESDFERPRKKKKTKRRERSEDLDETELADRRIEELERERKRARKDKPERSKKSKDYMTSDEEDAEGEPDDDDVDMDVESEEE